VFPFAPLEVMAIAGADIGIAESAVVEVVVESAPNFSRMLVGKNAAAPPGKLWCLCVGFPPRPSCSFPSRFRLLLLRRRQKKPSTRAQSARRSGITTAAVRAECDMPEPLCALLVMGRSVGTAVLELVKVLLLDSGAAVRLDVGTGVEIAEAEEETRAAASLEVAAVEKVVESVDDKSADEVLLPSVGVDWAVDASDAEVLPGGADVAVLSAVLSVV